MKKLQFFRIVFLAALLSLPSAYAAKKTQKVTNEDLIKFSHKLHLVDVGAGCTDCHTSAATATTINETLLPTMQTCFTCHDPSTKCTVCHTSPDSTTYRDLVLTSSPVFFNHKEHAGTLKVKCETCHQGLDKVTYAELAPNGGLPKMDVCMTCHGQAETNFRIPRQDTALAKVDTIVAAAPAGCDVCHRDLADLVPVSHRDPNFMTRHGEFVNALGPQNTCKSCHTTASCQECHDASNLAKDITPGQPYVPATPSLSPIITHKTLTIQRVHPSGWRFTHGIQAEGRESDCYTCHDERTFCVQCHNSEANGPRIEPIWHLGGDFVTSGVGTNGGRHAIYARRDIESCASCHDVEGADPVCITCHSDPTGIRGTDPNPHAPFFMHDVDGSWHTDPGAVCYTCHTDPNAHPGGRPGVGFCGYCHGSNPGR